MRILILRVVRAVRWRMFALAGLLMLLSCWKVEPCYSLELTDKNGSVSAPLAVAIFSAMEDYRKHIAKEGETLTLSVLAQRCYAVAFNAEKARITVHILEGDDVTFGGGVSYTIDSSNYQILERRFGR